MKTKICATAMLAFLLTACASSGHSSKTVARNKMFGNCMARFNIDYRLNHHGAELLYYHGKTPAELCMKYANAVSHL